MVASHPAPAPAPAPLAMGTSIRIARAVVDGFPAIPRSVREELAQEAALRSWRRRGVGRQRAYVRKTARNLALDWLRHLQIVRAHRAVGSLECVQEPVEARLDARRAVSLLEAEAPVEYRVVLRLYLDGTPAEELVEEALGASRSQVDARTWGRARDLLYKRRARCLSWLRARLDGQ